MLLFSPCCLYADFKISPYRHNNARDHSFFFALRDQITYPVISVGFSYNILFIISHFRDADSFDMRKKLPFCVGLLLRLLKKNHRVYVTCTSGLDRSPACVIAYLHWMTDTSLHAAYNFVTGLHSCRPDR